MSVFALAEPTEGASVERASVETLKNVRVQSCQTQTCFEVLSRSATRSLVRDEYVLEDVKLTIRLKQKKNASRGDSAAVSKSGETFLAASARTSSDWGLWILDTAKGSILFDAETGQIER